MSIPGFLDQLEIQEVVSRTKALFTSKELGGGVKRFGP